jgi:hypothetical protein
MSVLDTTTVIVLIALTLLRVGLPIFGMCVLCAGLKRALPAQV